MTHHLTASQRAQLEGALRLRQGELDRRLAAHNGGTSRAEHAREVLLQDGDDAPQREADRELDMALSDREIVELGEVSRALQRLRAEEYGLCSGCGTEIPFERLQVEPHAQRCVACETVHERSTAH
ncbi:DnaK suppressor protein [Burkholderiales bacterium JOSHI_001]|nr:DnaK suppressor protein [Burkholderiales bacterium JOSHI_001]